MPTGARANCFTGKTRRLVRPRSALLLAFSLALVACGDDGDDTGDAGEREPDDVPADDFEVPPLPEVEGPVPFTELGDIYVDPLELNFDVSVEDHGYVFEEHLVFGEAAGEPYKVRVLVVRPGEDAEVPFTGHAIVEAKHGTGIPFVWNFTRDYLMANGHAAVEISIFPSTVTGFLHGHDLDRYGELEVAEDVADEEVEAAGAADIYAQVGLLLKSEHTPLPGVEWLHMTGHSMAVGPVWHYMDTHHNSFRLEDGGPIYDGFLPETTRTASRKGPFPQVDVPTVLLNSELEVEAVIVEDGIDYRRPDSDEPGEQFRLFEVAGMPHNPAWTHPLLQDIGIEEEAAEVCEHPRLNRFPYQPMVSMALDHLLRWVGEEVPPPTADRIALTGDPDDPDDPLRVERDEHGNAVGGVRTTTLDVPLAVHTGLNSDDPLVAGDCLVYGSQLDLAPEQLADLYGDRDGYVDQVDQRLDELISEGWYLEMFADELRAEAEATTAFDI